MPGLREASFSVSPAPIGTEELELILNRPSEVSFIRAFGPQGRWGKLFILDKHLKVYLSYRNRQEHFYRKTESWGISEGIFDYLKAMGVQVIVIRIAGEGDIMATLDDFQANADETNYNSYEPQAHLGECHWRWINPAALV